MWKLRKCTRCNGDFYFDRDDYDWYMACLQCGYVVSLKFHTASGKELVPVKWSREKRITRNK